MKYYIPKGWHYSIPRIFNLTSKSSLKWKVDFNNTCKYDIETDQSDWNKLVGISNYLNPRKESIRFVWRYDAYYDAFRIAIYKEVNYKWEVHNLCWVKKSATLEMNFINDIVEIFADKKHLVILTFNKKKVTLINSPYFGGNRTAPHCMSLKLTQL